MVSLQSSLKVPIFAKFVYFLSLFKTISFSNQDQVKLIIKVQLYFN